jgi:hypothetical protein
MLGFGKKKKKEAQEETIAAPTPSPPEKKPAKKGKKPSKETEIIEKALPPKKKKFINKKIIVIFLILGALGVSSFLVYTLYFTPKVPENTVYQARELSHVKLPEEMLKFSFEHFPNLYISLVAFNREITLFNREIARIETIAQKYPEQKKIADTEKKVLEKGKTTLIKAFSKLEKPVKETYVLFQVNETQGLERIKEQKKELADMAQTALKASQEQTGKIKVHAPPVPDGIFQGTLYKLKKKFL